MRRVLVLGGGFDGIATAVVLRTLLPGRWKLSVASGVSSYERG